MRALTEMQLTKTAAKCEQAVGSVAVALCQTASWRRRCSFPLFCFVTLPPVLAERPLHDLAEARGSAACRWRTKLSRRIVADTRPSPGGGIVLTSLFTARGRCHARLALASYLRADEVGRSVITFSLNFSSSGMP